ncbi:MAG TPA: glycosyltransferase family 39 protein [Anaerolineae bacterium]|nr:glycosyltransferase family 39 protein [Anaerolineae bacterium]
MLHPVDTTSDAPAFLRAYARNLGAFIRANAFPVTLFLVLRVWTIVWASVIAFSVQPSAEATKQYYGVGLLRDALIAPWQRWDTIWYTKIALEGYTRNNLDVAFFPLFPILIRLVNPIVNNPVAAGLFITSIAALAAFILFYHIAREMYNDAAAKRALLFLGLFPTAFFWFAAYTESLFLALVLGAFLCARSRCWVRAGILGGLAALTRPQGVLIVLPLAVEFWVQYRQQRVNWQQAWTLVLVASGSAAYFLWLTLQFGDPRTWFAAQERWRHFAPPWEIFGGSLYQIIHAPSVVEAVVASFDPLFAILFFGVLMWSWFRLPRSYSAYLAVILLPSFFSYSTQNSILPLASLSRFVSVAFPAFLLLGSLKKSWWQAPLVALSFLLQTLWFMLFIAWVFVG